MSDHVVYARPLIVTEERIREAREKQMKQQAFKEALDRQMAQSKKLGKSKVNDSEDRAVPNDPTEKRYTFRYDGGDVEFIHVDNMGRSKSPQKAGMEEKRSKTEVLELAQKRFADPTVILKPTHQSNSLPPNFAMSTSAENPLALKCQKYDTKSLPVDMVYSKTKNTVVSGIVSTPRVLDLLPRGTSNGCSPLLAEPSRDHEYQTNCLPRNFNIDEVKMQLQNQPQPQQKQQKISSPRQQQQQQQQRHSETPRRSRASMGVNRSPSTRSPRTPKRPGAPLPPLEDLDRPCPKRLTEESSPFLGVLGSPGLERLRTQGLNGGNHQPPGRKFPTAQRGRSNELHVRPAHGYVASRNVQARVTETKVERLRKELESREFEMAKMREKERNWEEQVKQLKLELKNAKKKERDLNKLVMEGPRRAETAPDQPLLSPPVLGHSDASLKNDTGTLPAFVRGKKDVFSKSRTFMETFRPISAPSDTVSTSYVPPEQQETVSPLQESFKYASVLTRKTAFGLPEEKANRPVPIEYEHLLQFVNEQIITQQQADELWRLFTNGPSPLALIHRHSSNIQGFGDPMILLNSKHLALSAAARKLEHDVARNGEDGELEEGEIDRGLRPSSINGCSDRDSLVEFNTFETSAVLHAAECPSEDESYNDENPLGLLDEVILTRLREALDGNDRFSHLILDNNRLTDDAIGILAAILKESTTIESLSLRSCSLRDVDLMHILTSLSFKKKVEYIDLSKNPGITNASLTDIARLIRNAPKLKTLLMKGTNLQQTGCSTIIAAMESNLSIRVLELPYTVGFKVLDRVQKLMRMRDENVPESPTQDDINHDFLSPFSVLPNECKADTSTVPSGLKPSSKLVLPSLFEVVPKEPPFFTPKKYVSFNSNHFNGFHHWVDPAVRSATVNLEVLNKRCHLLDVYRQEQRERRRARRGLDGKSGRRGCGLAYRL